MNMKNLTLTLCLSLAALLGSTGTSWGADYEKGLAAYQGGDFATALREWSPLAEQGNAYAQNNLGTLYANGWGVPKDYKTAAKWWTLAAEQGYVLAQYNLGQVYLKGQGVAKNNVYAYMWADIVAVSGDQNGVRFREKVAKDMTSAQITLAQDLVRECVRKKYKGC